MEVVDRLKKLSSDELTKLDKNEADFVAFIGPESTEYLPLLQAYLRTLIDLKEAQSSLAKKLNAINELRDLVGRSDQTIDETLAEAKEDVQKLKEIAAMSGRSCSLI